MVSKPAQGDIHTSVASGVDALRALEPIKTIDATPRFTYSKAEIRRCLPSPSVQRRLDSRSDNAVDLHSSSDVTSRGSRDGLDPPTIFYLAYGSNLSAETFQGKRGIRPISQLNVLVPELALTFDIPGIPYLEPCFANTKYRSQKLQRQAAKRALDCLRARPPAGTTKPGGRKAWWELCTKSRGRTLRGSYQAKAAAHRTMIFSWTVTNCRWAKTLYPRTRIRSRSKPTHCLALLLRLVQTRRATPGVQDQILIMLKHHDGT